MSVEHLHAVPHLTTALSGPLYDIESHLLTHQAHIEAWFRSEWLKTPAPFYASVDLRNAGFKLAPVDTNLFPAGFNNLNDAFMPLCIQAAQAAVERVCPDAAKILLIPESHSRNTYYMESVATLMDILRKGGFEVRVASLMADLELPQTIELPSGRRVLLEKPERDDARLKIGDFDPCVALLNNDLSGGRPVLLEGLEQKVIPPLNLGWADRLKSEHFAHYRSVAREFATMAEIDPWLIDPLFRNCGEINFMKREGEECLHKNVTRLLADIQDKYDEYNIDKPPYVIIKADAGTYGMGIMAVQSAEEALELNRKQRTKMSKSKGGQAVTQVIMQEGVYTFETWGDQQAVAEPVVYMLDHFVVGGFYRVHKERGANENLNAPGMHFEPLAFAETCNAPDENKAPDADPNRFYAYGVIARLALLAAAREYAEHP
ncbi:glutamate--cysteine ligase [Thiohalophilus sp.]|uniref:glutamate--cysteine ligase n=1 Tax=Thiohalophilus sp. TaxID=3028392 RepID=UPI003975A7A5